MTSPAATAMLPLIKIAVIPIILISIYLRNRRQRQRRIEALAQDRAEAAGIRLDLSESRADRLRAVLARRDAGDRFVTPQGTEVSSAMIATRLAAVLMAEGDLREAGKVLSETLADLPGDATSADRRGALVLMARLHALQGREADARDCLSEAADLSLEKLRAEARGDFLLLAERLAGEVDRCEQLPVLADPVLAECGPMALLQLSGRGEEARRLASDLISRIDRALSETEDDPSGKVDGFPRRLLVEVREDLARLGQMPG